MPVRVSPTDGIRHHIDELFARDLPLPEILEEVARLGAQLLMQAALEAEVTEFLGRDRYQRRQPAPVPGSAPVTGYREVTVKTTALRRMLRLGILAALDQRIALRYAIPPMTPPETTSYIGHHLKLAGRSDPLFSDDAITLVHEAARGLPRAVNNIALQALVAAYADRKALVDEARPHRRHRGHVRPTTTPPARTPRPRPAHAGGAVACPAILTSNDAYILIVNDREQPAGCP